MAIRVAVFVGSLRKASWNRKVAQALIALAPASLQPEIIEIGQLPLYNQDLDDAGSPPAEWTAFRQRVKAYGALLFVTPEAQPLRPGTAQERDRRGLASLRAERVGPQARRGGQRFARRDRRLRRQPSPAAVARLPQRALPADAGGVSRRHPEEVRREGRAVGRQHARVPCRASWPRTRIGSSATRPQHERQHHPARRAPLPAGCGAGAGAADRGAGPRPRRRLPRPAPAAGGGAPHGGTLHLLRSHGAGAHAARAAGSTCARTRTSTWRR